jgi:FixJ family two-component response regulator
MEVVSVQFEPPVCIVDADPAVRDSISAVVDLHGIAVASYSTGIGFLNDVERLMGIRCVLCDAQLPDASGIEIYRRLLARGFDVPFALMLSRQSSGMQKAARALGIDAVLEKPLLEPSRVVEFITEPVL